MESQKIPGLFPFKSTLNFNDNLVVRRLYFN